MPLSFSEDAWAGDVVALLLRCHASPWNMGMHVCSSQVQGRSGSHANVLFAGLQVLN
jgi:hypothetical protein